MLSAGDRVRVRWSGRVGRVLIPVLRRLPDQAGPPGVLVKLDPFVARWAGTTPVTIINLEVVYRAADLVMEPPCPPRSAGRGARR